MRAGMTSENTPPVSFELPQATFEPARPASALGSIRITLDRA